MNAITEPQLWADRIYTGTWRACTGGSADVHEPATGAVIGKVGLASIEDVDAAAQIAHRKQPEWAATPFDRRAAVLREAAAILRSQASEFAEWNIRECGSIGPKADWEVSVTIDQMIQAAGLAGQPDGELFPSSVPGRTNMWRRVPVGVVGVIAPWNFPLYLAMRSIAPALALGNTVVVKPDVQSAINGGALIARLFEQAGLPEGVLHVLPGGPDIGDALVKHSLVDMISFTGSTAVGRKIGETCGRMLKKCALELGGNNAIVVLDDADLDRASSCAAWGAFLHQGQICMQAGRHLVTAALPMPTWQS